MAHDVREMLTSYAYQVFLNDEPGAGFTDFGGYELALSTSLAHQVTLHMGAIVSPQFFGWVMGHADPCDLRIVQFDEIGRELRSWALQLARVSKVTATTFTGTSLPFRIEALDLTVKSVTITEKP